MHVVGAAVGAGVGSRQWRWSLCRRLCRRCSRGFSWTHQRCFRGADGVVCIHVGLCIAIALGSSLLFVGVAAVGVVVGIGVVVDAFALGKRE